MSWKKHFSPVPTQNNPDGKMSPFSRSGNSGQPGPATSNYSSFLPDVYSGAPNRVDRYGQYNTMDQDSEVNAALDILAEFCSQKNPVNDSPFNVKYKKTATNAEITIIKQYLQQWCKLQNFETKMFRIVRNVFKYGDQFFLRDPETHRWLHVDPANVSTVIVNESEGKTPMQYRIQNINFNFIHGIATTPHETSNTRGPVGTQFQPVGGASQTNGQPQTGSYSASRFNTNQEEYTVDAKHVVHLSLSEGLDNNFPFGTSLLETVYKVYKQKELLEDAIIIYRVQRAPERRVFYVDVGNMPPHLAMSFVERVKTEIHQRRIPSSTGGGDNLIDSSYNPLGITEDYFFPACLVLDTRIPLLDGRTLTLSEIIKEHEEGKENFVYGLSNETHELEPARIEWAGVTRKDAELYRVHLDNGEYVDATPDHLFITRDGEEVMAMDLKEGDSLMPLDSENRPLVIISEIEKIDHREDTGDITISSASDSHWFGLESGIYVHNSESGRGSKVETLPGGSSLGEIQDLLHFTNKLVRGLRIPSSYLPTGADDSSSQFNDGRVGTAYIQELRFNTYCERLQSLITEEFDQEFKLYLLKRGVNVDTSMFDLKFQEPQNFAAYRQSEVDNARVGTYSQMSAIPYISNRFALKRFLGLSDDEIAENERMWLEENEGGVPADSDSSSEMRDAGISSAGIDSDLGGLEDELPDDGEPIDAGMGDDVETSTDQTVGPSGSGPAPQQ